jgi:DNA helicase-2/ATP-dependent DNA helicase PcrA
MLNERQQEAVNYTEGPLLILAGAGAGKTKTIVERIIHIIKNGTEPKKILAITFTNKAAKEMRERILNRMREEGMIEPYETVGYFANIPMIKTFHSLGMYILQEEYERANLTKRLTIYDESDALSFIKEILEREGIDPKMHEPRRVKGAISRLKGDQVDKDIYRQNAFSPFQKVVARVWPIYENEMSGKKVVDFDDLIVKTLKLLKENEDICLKYQNKWKYVHVDEYQDTNNTQYELTKILSQVHKNICAVGDVDQNIYSWRGANLKNLLKFEEDFSTKEIPAKTILLEQNYRSTKTIISAANEIIKKNKIRKEKNLFTENEEGEVITIYTGYDDRQEASFVARQIKDLIKQGVSAGDICILYRTNFQSRSLEQALLGENIPYHVLGVRFFDRKEVKDVMSYLRLALNTQSVEDLKRAISNPTRGFGKVALTKILGGNTHELPTASQAKLKDFYKVIEDIQNILETALPSEIVMKIIVDSGMEKKYKEEGDEESLERLGNVYELVTLATEYDKYGTKEGMDKFLEEASLFSDQDTDTPETEKVRLMTVHASKGLEFHYVFITGLESDLFPSRKMSEGKLSPEESEEERRLFYVALTRARKKLFLTNAKNRMLFGKRQMQMRSEFLDDLPDGTTVEEEDYYDPGAFGGEKIVVYL